MKALNRAVKRNADRCPKDFMFQTSSREWENLKYQIGTSSSGEESQALRYQLGTLKTGHGGPPKPPYLFSRQRATLAGPQHQHPPGSPQTRFCLAPALPDA